MKNFLQVTLILFVSFSSLFAQDFDHVKLSEFYNITIENYFELRMDSIAKTRHPRFFIVNDSLPANISKEFKSFDIELLDNFTGDSTQIVNIGIDSLFRMKRKIYEDTVDIIITQIWNRKASIGDKYRQFEIVFDRGKEKRFVNRTKGIWKRVPDSRFVYEAGSGQWIHQNKYKVISENIRYRANVAWLKEFKTLSKSTQWVRIKERFFWREKLHRKESLIRFDPLLIIDGVPLSISDSASAELRRTLADLLLYQEIQSITVMDTMPEGVHVNHAFVGVIVVTLNNKRTSKKFRKIIAG